MNSLVKIGTNCNVPNLKNKESSLTVLRNNMDNINLNVEFVL